MTLNTLKQQIQHVDIYLLDQILKGRYLETETILDAGCGTGRNIKWFCNNKYDVYGIDANKKHIEKIKELYSELASNFSEGLLTALPYEDEKFNHVICCAVLHFAEDEAQFYEMFSELTRVLKSNGTLFIRVASNFGIEDKIIEKSKGVYLLPDRSHRFLLTESILQNILTHYNLELLEPIKTVNVQDIRCMTTLMFRKK